MKHGSFEKGCARWHHRSESPAHPAVVISTARVSLSSLTAPLNPSVRAIRIVIKVPVCRLVHVLEAPLGMEESEG